jgi:UDP-N-acetylglucosamine 1-carboxyvinyltransferase
MGDRIECGTFCVVATISQGNLKIKGFDAKLIKTELNLLKRVGAKIKTYKNLISIIGPKKIKNIKLIETKEYNGFPTDLQAQFMSLLCKANGKSVISESIFENRFMHVAELRRLGAKITIKNNKANIFGNTNFQGAELMSSDLRASVALVLASIVANGTSVINRIYHLDRGYESIEKKLSKIGVNIKRVS